MIPYLTGMVIAAVLWALVLGDLREKARNNPTDKKAASNARLAWLSFFLLPVYPALLIVVLLGAIIKDFRHLGRLDEEGKQ
jgi:hypothetical protein